MEKTFNDGSHYSTYWSSTDIYRYSSSRAAQHVRYNVKEDDLYVIVFVNENWRRGAELYVDYSMFKTNYVVPPAVKPVCGPDATLQNAHAGPGRVEKISLHTHEQNIILLTTPNVPLPQNNTVTIATMSQSTDDIAAERVFTISYTCTELDICWAWC